MATQLRMTSFCVLHLLLLFSKFFLPLFALNDESQILNSFKAFITEDPEHAMANWNSSSAPDPCTWNGIACSEGKVISISLPKKRLLGTLSPSLGSLPSLRHINLRGNFLQGRVPPGLLGAKGLQGLVLSGNLLSGPLPSEIGGLFYLQVLDLSHNLINEVIPCSLLECKRLKILDLSNNNLTGSLPINSWTNLASLEKLSVAYNRLNGSIPSDMGNLSSLRETIDLSHNLFSGEIPASLGNLPEKVYIDLAFNNLSGPIPQNGALVNRGPTAFIGNPGLCGSPLKNPCPSPASPPINPEPASGPDANASNGKSHNLSKIVVVAIVVADLVVIGLMAVIFYCCYKKAVSRKTKEQDNGSSNEMKNGKCCTCFRQDNSETPPDEQFDLIPLDKQVKFDLDELFKATAVVLGRSEIGIVYKVVLEDGLTLAVRRLGEGGTQKFKDFQTEVEAIGKVRHPNIVCLRAYYWSIDEKLLIYDYVPNGNLSAAIHGNGGIVKFSPMPWNIRLEIMKGVAKGLAFLHEFSPKKYVHGDLKPNNILLGVNLEPYISDFGLGHLANMAAPLLSSKGRPTDKLHSPFSEGAVSPIPTSAFCYQAPEALKSLKPSQKWDVYSYGVILLELISGRSPIILMDTSDMDIVKWIQLCISESKPLPEILDPCLAQQPEKEAEYVAVLKIAFTCVQENHEKRPSMKNVADLLEKLS